jgi:hypothetical protein
MPNLQKVSFHQQRAETLSRALSRAHKMQDRKFYVDIDNTGKPTLMTTKEIASAIDKEQAAARQALGTLP